MISIEDCLAMCELSATEVAALAEHERIPQIEAAALAQYLIRRADGPPLIRRYILDDIAAARKRGDYAHVAALRQALQQFLEQHPEAASRV